MVYTCVCVSVGSAGVQQLTPDMPLHTEILFCSHLGVSSVAPELLLLAQIIFILPNVYPVTYETLNYAVSPAASKP